MVRKCLPVVLLQRVRDVFETRVRQDLAFHRTPEWDSAPAIPRGLLDGRYRGTGASMDQGVNLYGYFSRWLGLGECARLYANAMLASGYPISLHDVDLDIPHARRDNSLASLMDTTSPFPRDLIFVNPDHWEDTLRAIKATSGGSRHVIGYWFWELENFPKDWRRALDQVDEIMVSSEFVENVIRRVCDKPVTRVPMPVMLGDDSGLQRRHFGLREDDYVFFCSFDFNSAIARKNPLAAIEVFRQAFPRGDEKAVLLIKSSNGNRHSAMLMQLLASAAVDPRVVVRDDLLERSHLQALHRCIDVYVSLHRCEGFGLGMAEAMCMGKPVIATGYSGNMDFMTTANSCLVNYAMVPVQPGEYPHAEGQRWADPDRAHAAHHFTALYEDRELGAVLGAQAARDMARDFSVEACMRVLERRLRAIDVAYDEPV